MLMKLSWTAVIVILALAAGAAGALYVRGRACVVVQVRGEVRDLTVTDDALIWIEAPAEPGQGKARVLTAGYRGGTEPRSVVEAHDIRSLVVRGDSLYALTQTDPTDGTGQLVRRTRDGKTEVLLGGLHRPQSLVVDDTALCWTEARAAPTPGIAHVPVLGVICAVRVLPAVAGKPAGGATPRLVALTESAKACFDGQLLGLRDGNLYWVERVAGLLPASVTSVRGAPLAGGDPRTLARARGPRTAALGPHHIYWTDASDEMASPDSGSTVRRVSFQAGPVETVTDWLSSTGALMTDGDRVFFAGGGWFWRVPQRLDRPLPLVRCNATTPGTVAVHGSTMVAVGTLQGTRPLERRPLSWRGYVHAALAPTLPVPARQVAGREAGGR